MSAVIGCALLSYGMSGEVFHEPLINAHKGFELKRVLVRNPGKSFSHLPVTHNFEDILRDESIELIIVNTPNDSHFAYAMRAIQAGKHVVVEKPFTVISAEADELIEASQKNKVALTVFQNRRWDGGFMTVQKIVKQGLLGRVVEFELHYDRYRNYIEPGTWKEKPDPGTGILYNLGSHMLDQVLVLFGRPSSVDARIGIQRTGGHVPDFYDIRLEYPGVNVIVKSSYLVREAGPMYRVNGTDGSFVKFGIDPQEQALKEKKIPGTPGWGTESREWWGRLNTNVNGLHFDGLIETVPGNYSAFYDNLYSHITAGERLAVKPSESRDVIVLIEAAMRSAAAKKAVEPQF